MTVENIYRSTSIKVWDWAGIELMTPGSAIRLKTNGATGPSNDYRDQTYSYALTPAGP